MTRVPVYLLAGGRSRRFGSDKARAVVDGRPLLQHAAGLLDPVASRITVVADRAGKYRDLGFRTIADAQPGLGPLAGLQAALSDLAGEEPWLLLCSCDAVVIRRHWLETLLGARTEAVNAVAFRGEHWQPMPALYGRGVLPILERQLATEHRGMQRLLDQVGVAEQVMPADWPALWQINTASSLTQYRAARERETSRATESHRGDDPLDKTADP